jgi:hypothetical protein
MDTEPGEYFIERLGVRKDVDIAALLLKQWPQGRTVKDSGHIDAAEGDTVVVGLW